jgi:hypothetical protein
MKIAKLIARLRPRRSTRPQPLDTQNWDVRDWADLPVHHPRGN